MIRNILSKLNFDDVQNDGNGHWRMYWPVEESAQWIICCVMKSVAYINSGCGNAHSTQKIGMSWTHLQDERIKNTKEMLEGKKYMVVDQQGSQTTGGEVL